MLQSFTECSNNEEQEENAPRVTHMALNRSAGPLFQNVFEQEIIGGCVVSGGKVNHGCANSNLSTVAAAATEISLDAWR